MQRVCQITLHVAMLAKPRTAAASVPKQSSCTPVQRCWPVQNIPCACCSIQIVSFERWNASLTSCVSLQVDAPAPWGLQGSGTVTCGVKVHVSTSVSGAVVSIMADSAAAIELSDDQRLAFATARQTLSRPPKGSPRSQNGASALNKYVQGVQLQNVLRVGHCKIAASIAGEAPWDKPAVAAPAAEARRATLSVSISDSSLELAPELLAACELPATTAEALRSRGLELLDTLKQGQAPKVGTACLRDPLRVTARFQIHSGSGTPSGTGVHAWYGCSNCAGTLQDGKRHVRSIQLQRADLQLANCSATWAQLVTVQSNAVRDSRSSHSAHTQLYATQSVVSSNDASLTIDVADGSAVASVSALSWDLQWESLPGEQAPPLVPARQTAAGHLPGGTAAAGLRDRFMASDPAFIPTSSAACPEGFGPVLAAMKPVFSVAEATVKVAEWHTRNVAPEHGPYVSSNAHPSLAAGREAPVAHFQVCSCAARGESL